LHSATLHQSKSFSCIWSCSGVPCMRHATLLRPLLRVRRRAVLLWLALARRAFVPPSHERWPVLQTPAMATQYRDRGGTSDGRSNPPVTKDLFFPLRPHHSNRLNKE